MSFWATAMVEAKSAVNAPTAEITSIVVVSGCPGCQPTVSSGKKRRIR